MLSDFRREQRLARKQDAAGSHAGPFEAERIAAGGFQFADFPVVDSVGREPVETDRADPIQPFLVAAVDVLVLSLAAVNVERAGYEGTEILGVDVVGDGLQAADGKKFR